MHVEPQQHFCDYCLFIGSSKKQLKDHISDCHQTIECGRCMYKATPACVEYHYQKVHVEPQQHFCDYCLYIGSSKKQLQDHIDKDHEDIKIEIWFVPVSNFF